MNAADAKRLTEEAKQSHKASEDQKKRNQRAADEAWVSENFDSYLAKANSDIREAAGKGANQVLLFSLSKNVGDFSDRLTLMGRKVAEELRKRGFHAKEEPVAFSDECTENCLIASWD